MVKDRLPRRLKRFARKKEVPEGEAGERISAALMRGAKEEEEVPHFLLYKRMREKGKRRIPSMEKAKKEVNKFQEEKGRIPTGKEMDEMAENLFQQIKEGKLKEEEIEEVKPGREEERESYKERAMRRRREEVKEEKPMAGIEKKEVTKVKDLFKEELKEEKKEEGMELIKEFSEEEEEKTEEGELEGMEEVPEEEEKEKCPHCNKEGETIYCPECGEGFCEKCAGKPKASGKTKKYRCPSCGKEVKVGI